MLYVTPRRRRLQPQRFPIPEGQTIVRIDRRIEEWKAWKARVGGGTNPYPEFVFFDWLERQGWRQFLDFQYQVALGGGRAAGGGGFIVDFILEPSISGRRLPVEVYGSAFHTAAVFTNPAEQRGFDVIKRELLHRLFGDVVYCDETQLLNNTDRTMRLTIQGFSTSKGP